MNPFIITTTKKVVANIKDGNYRNNAYVSIVPSDEQPPVHVNLVIGAAWEHRCASCFSKKSLGDLIADLKEVYEAMGEWQK